MLINYEVDIIIVTPLSTRIHSTVHRLRNGQGATLNSKRAFSDTCSKKQHKVRLCFLIYWLFGCLLQLCNKISISFLYSLD